MAKNNKKNGVGYIFLAIGFAVVMAVNIFLVTWIYGRFTSTSELMSTQSRSINSANGQLQTLNEQFTQLVT